MAQKFIVLSITDSSLRSVLTARLTILGVDVLTHEGWAARGSAEDETISDAILVTDDESFALRESEARGWRQVLVLNGSPSAESERPVRHPKTATARSIAELLLRL